MVISDSSIAVIPGLGEQVPHPSTVLSLQVHISCFMSNLDPRKPLSEGTYFPWDRSQAESEGILQRGVSGKGFGVAPSPQQDLFSAGLREPIAAGPRHQEGNDWAGQRRTVRGLTWGQRAGICL